jgi:hypothetical protein
LFLYLRLLLFVSVFSNILDVGYFSYLLVLLNFLVLILANGSNPLFFWRRAPQQMLQTHRSLEAYCATLWWRWLVFSVFPCNGAAVEWNWQWKTEVLGEKRVPVPLCPPQIPHGLSRDRIRASAVRGQRLTASIYMMAISHIRNSKHRPTCHADCEIFVHRCNEPPGDDKGLSKYM